MGVVRRRVIYCLYPERLANAVIFSRMVTDLAAYLRYLAAGSVWWKHAFWRTRRLRRHPGLSHEGVACVVAEESRQHVWTLASGYSSCGRGTQRTPARGIAAIARCTLTRRLETLRTALFRANARCAGAAPCKGTHGACSLKTALCSLASAASLALLWAGRTSMALW